MTQSNAKDIVVLGHFVQAARDSGYKSTAYAIAELIDNSFEAGAATVDIYIAGSSEDMSVSVSDDGVGMTPSVLQFALQFGGTTRFNSREGAGRYGMGLPSSSFSQARRVDVYSSTSPKAVWWSYLDVDQIVAGTMKSVPTPRRAKNCGFGRSKRLSRGTTIVWSKCDRLDFQRQKTLVAKLQKSLGRIFRHQLWCGNSIRVNGELVRPVDPLFFRHGNNLFGASRYGPPLKYNIETNLTGCGLRDSKVLVTFTELPIEKWHLYSNEEKRLQGISSRAGVSIVRAEREIDYGWYFMGTKRKENYDDWWRCEIRFNPELDELFGVTNTKQGIRPTEAIKNILTADIERIARNLNSRVRQKYLRVRSAPHSGRSGTTQAESRDHLLEPPSRLLGMPAHLMGYRSPRKISRKKTVSGLTYRIEHRTLEDDTFFVPLLSARELIVIVNEQHPFYESLYAPILGSMSTEARRVCHYVELLLFAAARAECSLVGSASQKEARSLREAWSRTLAAFLG